MTWPRHYVSVLDLAPDEMKRVIDLGLSMKRDYYMGKRSMDVLRDMSFAVFFEKPSTRTRVSFDVAIRQLGGHPVILYASELQLARGETIADTARVLSRYVDGIIARVKKHAHLEEMARYSSVPVINALSDREHPVQVLGDLMTIKEKLGSLEGARIAFLGDGTDNVLYSLLLAASALGLEIRVAAPRRFWPEEDVLSKARELAGESGAVIRLTEDPVEAVRGANVVYTDVWVSMGREEEAVERLRLMKPYQVNTELLENVGGSYIFMHCLPAHRGQEVTDEVIDGPNSAVWDQAENRLHIQKALLYYLYTTREAGD